MGRCEATDSGPNTSVISSDIGMCVAKQDVGTCPPIVLIPNLAPDTADQSTASRQNNMSTKAIIVLFAALYTQSVLGSYHYHGPIAKPVVLHNGYLADTHEVAAAKNAHLAALAQQSHYGGHYGSGRDYSYSGSYGYGHGQGYSGSYGGHHVDFRYHGPIAIPHVLHDGHIADTHEVAAAKAAHFAAVAKAKAHGGYGDHYSGRYASGYGADHGHSHHVVPYHGPLAKPVVLKSGYLADTHEVATAKHHHLEALHEASRHGHYDLYYH